MTKHPKPTERQLKARLPVEVYDAAVERATAENRSLNNWFVTIVLAALDKEATV